MFALIERANSNAFKTHFDRNVVVFPVGLKISSHVPCCQQVPRVCAERFFGPMKLPRSSYLIECERACDGLEGCRSFARCSPAWKASC